MDLARNIKPGIYIVSIIILIIIHIIYGNKISSDRLSIHKSAIANAIGLISAKIVSGNTILGVSGYTSNKNTSDANADASLVNVLPLNTSAALAFPNLLAIMWRTRSQSIIY